MPPIVELRDVSKDYPLGKLVVRALRGVTLTIARGEFTTIAGPSGSGKTTLLNMIGCVDVPTGGEVVVDGASTSKLNDRQLTELRLHHLGFIFQSFNLINVLDAFQNVEFPLLLQGGLTKAERQSRVTDVIEKVGLREYAHHRPNELSGGQRQRVAIARALVTRPAIVLADEPTANLDSATGSAIIDLMRELNHRDHVTFIFSTHDPKIMSRADRQVLIEDGQIADDGWREEPTRADRGWVAPGWADEATHADDPTDIDPLSDPDLPTDIAELGGADEFLRDHTSEQTAEHDDDAARKGRR